MCFVAPTIDDLVILFILMSPRLLDLGFNILIFDLVIGL
jgi:hypothetical protein